MEAEARFNRVTVSTEAYNILSTNRDLAEIQVKVNNYESLTEVEYYRFSMAQMRFWTNVEWMFREMPVDGPERNYMERQIRRTLSNKLKRQVFLDRADDLDANFVSWVEDNILAP